MLSITIPAGFTSEFEVVSLYLEHDGQILLLHRHPHKSQGGKWGVPAGKANRHEDLIAALLREVYEETGLRMRPSNAQYFKSVYVKHPEHCFTYHMYHLAMSEKPLIAINHHEHQAYKWVAPNDAIVMNLVDDLATCINMFYFART